VYLGAPHDFFFNKTPYYLLKKKNAASGSEVVDIVIATVSEDTLAKAVCSPSHAKSTRNLALAMSLIRRGFFGLSAASPSLITADENPAKTCFDSPFLPLVKGSTPHSDGVAELGRGLSQPFSPTSSVSKSQLGYSRRVKEKVAKQLNKNKELLGIQSLAVAFLPSS
jgi:hypothetical protein